MTCFLYEDQGLSSCVYQWGERAFAEHDQKIDSGVNIILEMPYPRLGTLRYVKNQLSFFPEGWWASKIPDILETGANPYLWLVVRKFQHPWDNVHLKQARIFLSLNSCMVGSKSNRLTGSFSHPGCQLPKG